MRRTLSPRPVINTAPPRTRAGTSLPSSAAMPKSSAFFMRTPHNFCRPRNTAAASALPPPRPPPSGMRLVIWMRAPRVTPVLFSNNRAARRAMFSPDMPERSTPSARISTSTPGSSVSSSRTVSNNPTGISTLRSSW
ncbi:MAG: hypothetical protein FWF96_00130 [Kiritimatiellaeota bacterium]|nr:hypothetical protein [Kiritimatiellota bacterium]